jgi:transposase
MGQGGKKQKTDRRDSAELCDALDRYLRGQRKALSVVGVPSVEQEEKRALIRYHRQIMADRGRCEARGKGLLCAQGIYVSVFSGEVHGANIYSVARLEPITLRAQRVTGFGV